MRVQIVILNYRTAGMAFECLCSLEAEARAFPGVRVVVVDNASGDGCVENLIAAIERQGWSAWASVLPLTRNGGYSAGNNAGIKLVLSDAAPANYVLLLNPDTIVLPGALQTLVEFMEAQARVGIAGSRLQDRNGRIDPSARRFPTPWSELEWAARSGPISRLLSRHAVPMRLSDQPHRCGWVSGASIIIRRQVFEQVGLLDDGFFLYFDEVDFCLRAAKAGWECWYVPEAHVVHYEGQSTGIRAPGRRSRYWYDSRRRFFRKHYGLAGILAADACWAFGRAVLTCRRMLGLGGSTVGDPARFAWDLLAGDIKAILSDMCHLGYHRSSR